MEDIDEKNCLKGVNTRQYSKDWQSKTLCASLKEFASKFATKEVESNKQNYVLYVQTLRARRSI